MFVHLSRAVVVVAVLVAAWLLPSPANAASRHRDAHASRCEHTANWSLARTSRESLSALTRARNPDADNALDDVDDPDLGADRTPRLSVDRTTATSDPDITPPWLCARRAADARDERLILWRTLAAPRPPPSL